MNGRKTVKGGNDMRPEKKDQPEGISSEKSTDREYMSVREMGDLLGLKKTDRYWLVHKNVFETKTIAGKMWVDIRSFEAWYANQIKYHKVTGEEPGIELKARSYSPGDISKMLGICEQGVYELIKREQLETIVVDYWKRVPKDAFQRWYASQDHYKTAEDREKEASVMAASVSMPEMARILGTSRQKVYQILSDRRYQYFFDFIEIGGRRRITKESLQRFLEGQDVYCPVSEQVQKTKKMCSEEIQTDPENGYLSLQEAAQLAGISRQALSKYIDLKQIDGAERRGGKVRIQKQEFGKWMIRRMLREEAETDGID